MHADMLTCYFRGKLEALSEAISQQDSSEGEEEEAMDTSETSPQAASKLMGSAWVKSLHQIVAYMDQLGLGVCSYATAILTATFLDCVQIQPPGHGQMQVLLAWAAIETKPASGRNGLGC